MTASRCIASAVGPCIRIGSVTREPVRGRVIRIFYHLQFGLKQSSKRTKL